MKADKTLSRMQKAILFNFKVIMVYNFSLSQLIKNLFKWTLTHGFRFWALCASNYKDQHPDDYTAQ